MAPSRLRALHQLRAASPNLKTNSRAPQRPTPGRNPGPLAPRPPLRSLPRPRPSIRPLSRPQLRLDPAQPCRYLRRQLRRRAAPPHLPPLPPLLQRPNTLRHSRRLLYLHRLSPPLLQCSSQSSSRCSSRSSSRAARPLRPLVHEVRHHYARLGLPDPLR